MSETPAARLIGLRVRFGDQWRIDRSNSTYVAQTCGKTPGLCPQRESIRLAAGGVKSKAGRRAIGLPPQLVALLAPTGRSSRRSGRGPGSSGTTRAGYSQLRPASRSTRATTTASGSGCSRTPGCAIPGCATPGSLLGNGVAAPGDACAWRPGSARASDRRPCSHSPASRTPY